MGDVPGDRPPTPSDPPRRATDPPVAPSSPGDPVSRRSAGGSHPTGDRRARVVDRIRREEERFRRLAERASDVIVTVRTDPTVRFEYVAPAIEDLTGLTPEDLYDDPALGLTLLASPDGPVPWDPARPPGPGEVVQVAVRHRDGSEIWLESRTVVVDDPVEGRRVEGILRDITAAKSAEREFRDDMAAFIARAAHELRGSLAAVSTTAATLADHHEDLDHDTVVRIAGQLADGEARLRTLADRLLDLSTIETGSVHLDLVEADLGEIVRSCVEEARSNASGDQTIVLSADGPAPAVLDEIAVRQILANLLMNATLHGGTRIDVVVEHVRGAVLVAVEDDGPGVEEHLVAQLFLPFVRGRATRGTGTGLGLSISRGLAHAMGGDLTYEPVPIAEDTEATRFVLRLPGATGR